LEIFAQIKKNSLGNEDILDCNQEWTLTGSGRRREGMKAEMNASTKYE
jgi:hypothetical protein